MMLQLKISMDGRSTNFDGDVFFFFSNNNLPKPFSCSIIDNSPAIYFEIVTQWLLLESRKKCGKSMEFAVSVWFEA